MIVPDKWVIVKIVSDDGPITYKVFATWFGGYLGADSWKINSGITKVEEEGDYLKFFGHSGSCYECPKHTSTYGTNMYSQGVLNSFIEKATELGHTMEIMSVDTDWINLLKELN